MNGLFAKRASAFDCLVRIGRTATLCAAVLMLWTASSAQASCDCADVDGDGYPDADQVCRGTSVTQVSPYPGEGPAQPPAEISISFDRELSCGQYVNGDYWVVEPSAGAGVTITGTSPTFARTDEDGFGPTWKHGFQIDPVRVDASSETIPQGQSFDERTTMWIADGREGRASTPNPLPITVESGSSFVKSHSKPVQGGTPKKSNGSSGCQGTGDGSSQTCIRAFMVLTVLGEAPANPSDTFRPPYTGHWDRAAGRRDATWVKPGTGGKPGYRFADVRWGAFPKLSHASMTSLSGYISNIGHIRDSFRLPQIEILAHNHQRRLKAFDSSSGGPLYGDGGDYAPRWASVTNSSWLRLTGDDVRANPAESGFNEVHKHALVNLLQFGIDQLHLTIDGDKIYVADGGHYAGGYLPALMACHLFDSQDPVGYDVSSECAWLERNKSEGSTVDVGYPMWGEQTFVYRTPHDLDQQQICSELPARSGHSCDDLGIDPDARKVLYGQLFSQRPYTDAQKNEGGQGSCLGDWSGNVSTHCRDPHQRIDHPGNACNPDPDQVTKNYERIIQPNLRDVALIARLYGAFREDGTGPFPNHLWDFTARRYWLGYETQPDTNDVGSGSPTNYSGGTNRCSALHHKHACAEGKDCYPTTDEYGPVCWFCRGMLDRYATFVQQVSDDGTPPLSPPDPPVFLAP